jgi:hypothetical protein
MGNLRTSASLLILTLLTACGSHLPYSLQSQGQGNADSGNTLSGTFTRLDQSKEDLSASMDRPTILIFSQDTCSVCAHEADALLLHLARPSQNPTLVHLYTVLVGSNPDDASDWKHDHPVPWEVGIDPDSSLFKHYCSVHTVPCVVVYIPGKGIVMKHNGAVEFSDLTATTGKWEE